MYYPEEAPVTVYRNVAYEEDWVFYGIDLAGADLLMQVRASRDAAGDALINLEIVADIATEEGLFVSADTSGATPVSTVQVHIGYNTLQSVADAALGTAHAGDDCVLEYDLISTGIGFPMRMLARGPFIIEGSVTRLP